MENKQFLRNQIVAAEGTTSISEALGLLQEHSFNHIPLVDEGILLGMLSEEVLETSGQTYLDDIRYEMNYFSVRKDSRWQEVIEIFGKYDTNIVPVVDENNQYLGYYVLNDFIHLLGKTPFFTENGSFLIVEKDLDSFSFSEVSQIVEGNHGKIWGMFVSEVNYHRIQITLKVNLNSLTSLLQTFRRYGYEIVLEKEDDTYLQDLKEKSEYLQKYLTV